MKSFLLDNKTNKPIISWGMLPNNIHFIGDLPEGYSLAVCPGKYIVLDIDNKPGKVKGIDNIPHHLYDELFKIHFNYPSKSGFHVWIDYSGDKILKNTTSKIGCDLRVYYKGYVKWYLKERPTECEHLIKPSSLELNKFLEELFATIN